MNMKLNLVNNIGYILLAIWLIIYGVEQLFRGFRLSIGALLSILAIVAGVFILLGR